MLTGALLVQTDLRLGARRPARARLEPVHRAHPAREGFESFIAARFGRAYGAHVTHFLPHLLGVRDGLARWQAAAGYAAAGVQTLFLEQYLDQPIERAIATALGRPIARPGIVEVGNLAAISAGMARVIIPQLARHLHRLGYIWVVFTATRALRNSFRPLIPLGSWSSAGERETGMNIGPLCAVRNLFRACYRRKGSANRDQGRIEFPIVST
jgi:hypothetical protein